MINELKINDLEFKIASLKHQLFSTDYIAIKYAEGEISLDEFYPTKKKRQDWRKQINLLEEELILERSKK